MKPEARVQEIHLQESRATEEAVALAAGLDSLELPADTAQFSAVEACIACWNGCCMAIHSAATTQGHAHHSGTDHAGRETQDSERSYRSFPIHHSVRAPLVQVGRQTSCSEVESASLVMRVAIEAV